MEAGQVKATTVQYKWYFPMYHGLTKLGTLETAKWGQGWMTEDEMLVTAWLFLLSYNER
jgi:hypothetical protein